MLTLQRPARGISPALSRRAPDRACCRNKCSHRVVSIGDPADSDLEVYPYGEALLPVVVKLIGFLGALWADFVLEVLPEGFIC